MIYTVAKSQCSCNDCKKKWVAVVETESTLDPLPKLECPACGCMSGEVKP